jgi:hypothetical protein
MRILFILFLVFPLPLIAEELPLPKDMAEAFFLSIEKGEFSEGYDRLLIGSSIPQDKPQAVTMLKQQTQNGLPLYGKILGHELIKDEKFGSSIVRLVYTLKSEKAPTVWEFYFYKPKNSWFLATVIFNDQFGLLR